MRRSCSAFVLSYLSSFIHVYSTQNKEDADGMKIMARFTSHHSTYDGDGNRQKGASIFFSENFWTESENLYNSDNGDLVISRLKIQS